jgi:hypothetical protein
VKIYNSKLEAEEVLEKCINSIENILKTFDVKMGCDDSFYGICFTTHYRDIETKEVKALDRYL